VVSGTKLVNHVDGRIINRIRSKQFLRVAVASIAALCLCASTRAADDAAVAAPHGAHVVVEAESFQFHASWTIESEGGTLGGKYIRTSGSAHDVLTVVDVPTAGQYQLWTRARVFATSQPGTRRFRLYVNGQPAERESGVAAIDGWVWEHVGVADLKSGPAVLALRDTAKFHGRCDAVLLTTAEVNPNNLVASELLKYRVMPTAVTATPRKPFEAAPVVAADSVTKEVASIENEVVRLDFREVADASGRPLVLRGTSVRDGDGGWREVHAGSPSEAIVMLMAPKASLQAEEVVPIWNTGLDELIVNVVERAYTTGGGGRDPVASANHTRLTPRAVRATGAASAVVTYVSEDGAHQVEATWSLAPGRRDAKVDVAYVVSASGDHSVALSAFDETAPADVEAVQLPPLFQMQRLPRQPTMLTSSITPHALAMVQRAGRDGAALTLAVTADISRMPFEWPRKDNAHYGFSLHSGSGEIQPTAFAPVLGMPGSRAEAGERRTTSFHVLAWPGEWTGALEYASNQIFGVTDYRRPAGASLSQAALNMFDLLKDDKASGWDVKLKGLYNIESRVTATHTAPLAMLSAAVLSGDEDLWVRRALPTIEFLLTRPAAHFATSVPQAFPVYINEARTHLQVPGSFATTSTWQGIDALLGNANPWVADMAIVEGQPRHTTAFSTSLPRWSEMLAQYRLTPTPQARAALIEEADRWIKRAYHDQRTPLGLMPFYNVSFYPAWWDLIDLFELTGDRRYLAAAEEAAFLTIAGQRSHPAVTGQVVPINQGVGQMQDKGGGPVHFWYGDRKMRLGWADGKPTVVPPTTQAPDWVVSPVGLSMEQPVTYWRPTGGHQPIMLSNWAPHLLRLYKHTGREIFHTYARNAIIGRYANYPGYYVPLATDVNLDPRYPYRGPDLTFIYYQHIEPHLAMTLDYLFTEAELRSEGRIAFPWVKQAGYVWFNNCIFGGGRGRVFDDADVVPRLDRKTLTVDSDQINYIMGRGADRLWLVMMNESKEAVAATVKLTDPELMLGQPYAVYDGTGQRIGDDAAMTATLTPTVPPMGIIVLSLPAQLRQTPAQAGPVAEGHVVRSTGSPWGDVHAFRLRGPFGSDSIYVVATGRPSEGASMSVTLRSGGRRATVNEYPYEQTFYPVDAKEPAEVLVELNLPGQGAAQQVKIELKGHAP
jgi:hypothetical protein